MDDQLKAKSVLEQELQRHFAKLRRDAENGTIETTDEHGYSGVTINLLEILNVGIH